MRITVLGPQRRKPKIGDRRTTKKHGLQIRVVQTHNGMWVKSGSRHLYEWRKPTEILGEHKQWKYLLTAEEFQAAFMAVSIEKTVLFGCTSSQPKTISGLS